MEAYGRAQRRNGEVSGLREMSALGGCGGRGACCCCCCCCVFLGGGVLLACGEGWASPRLDGGAGKG